MREKHWTELVKPQRLDVRSRGTSATVVIDPLERGFGFTLGTALRRIMLASIPGWCVVAARISGATSGSNRIAWVREGLDEILLNLKELVIEGNENVEPRVLVATAAGKQVIRASDIIPQNGIEFIDPDQVICTTEENGDFRAELLVGYGKGYRSQALFPSADLPEGFVPIDSLFSPVRRVSFTVESTRLGQVLDYDRLVLEIATNGTVPAEDALSYAAGVLHDQLGVFVNFEDEPLRPAPPEADPLGFAPVLLKRIDELELSVRASNCMRHENVTYVGDLVARSEAELMRVPNFGRKSLNEIKLSLGTLGLSLGMVVPDWPPEDIEALARRFVED